MIIDILGFGAKPEPMIGGRKRTRNNHSISGVRRVGCEDACSASSVDVRAAGCLGVVMGLSGCGISGGGGGGGGVI